MKKLEHLEWLSSVDAALKPMSVGSVVIGGVPCVRVAVPQLGAAMEKVRQASTGLDLDLLEDAFIQDLGKHLELTCRLMSTRDPAKELIIKSEIPLKDSKSRPVVASISKAWPMAACFELEMGALFGVAFDERQDSGSEFSLHPPGEDVLEFPMRRYTAATSGEEASS